jgi:transposase InsO family protein
MERWEHKVGLLRKFGSVPRRTLDAVEYATLEWVDWFSNRRLLESSGHASPAEYEREYHPLNEAQAMAA